ncbi:MAG TPA: hypothetical protein DDW84_03345 [Phycisphaerales bacterium]|nr:MAG: hypothetical protein A2Y13_06910 [Planctomycetes bacterium GWC2_45_44]HBG77874.1 hypothetical protein [Phycisphaerales bacterium]HBR18649.1 hypothetical protein [Phycisphaerales bacterium]
MKSKTQIKIGRISAFFLIICFLACPPLFIYEKIETDPEKITVQMTFGALLIMYLFFLPLVGLLASYAWALKRNKQKTALILLIIYVIWGIIAISSNDLGFLIIEGITILFLLQGILGLRKISITKSE